MAAITYEAVNRTMPNGSSPIVAGHSAGSTYSIDVGLAALDEAVRVNQSVSTALNGFSEVNLYSIDKEYNVLTTNFVRGSASELAFIEFIYSVLSGEVFAFDPFGSVSVPDDALNAQLLGGFQIVRSENNHVAYSFGLRVNANL